MKPIIITTPRTGATILCDLLKDACGYRSDLKEFFFATDHAHSDYYIENDIIKITPAVITKKPRWSKSIEEIRTERLKLFEDHDPLDYMIKLHSFDLTDSRILEFIKHYDHVIFLERRRPVNQLLSYLAMMQTTYTGDSFFHSADSKPVSSITFDPVLAREISVLLKFYYRAKAKFKGPHSTIFYEDFVQDPAGYLAQKYNLSAEGTYSTVRTKYADHPEMLLTNPAEFEEFLLHSDTIFHPKI